MNELMELKYEFAMKVKKGLSLNSDEAKEYRIKIKEITEREQ